MRSALRRREPCHWFASPQLTRPPFSGFPWPRGRWHINSASWERDLFGGGESRFVINICGTHHSRDLSTCDSSLHIPHGSRDGTPLDSRPEMTQWAPSMTDNRKCVTSTSVRVSQFYVFRQLRLPADVSRCSPAPFLGPLFRQVSSGFGSISRMIASRFLPSVLSTTRKTPCLLAFASSASLRCAV